MSQDRVLIVEDYSRIADMYEQKLKLEGFSVEVASNGELALEKIGTFKPQLVLLDIMMSGMDGLQVLQKIRSNIETKSIKVIILSNLDSKEIIDKAEALGIDDYITKSDLTPKEVVDKIKIVLNNLDTEAKKT
ncbi:TPA: response regulator [candidate division CPR2 bacterium]|uniref:Two component transcriptional regulator, winged helix family protein n=1 Tax=candidate division CPR2 bacterium GW2011_GWC1_41_48 TaxID=1618344 RepID=A0A0G0W6Z8_UNCC2|nr:MAG: Two component transcriptional regulator, winged helix family protein [candidate division CPR2 bacterium GW2011_GWC2_39_35]KKR28252.1 MAG: Two component transcriptional regulator, winged helix family protein [candidate division CPR2 bacterium GW2011_GWD2_39_7]KKS08749.1 MAG: Two component transcriptional regulator, winged helix family protein [candidate division CPR2 bacterium GW2011_GWC1_41_48]OGB72424.1 MAG: hypothetical protein A2Y26_03305 [candidate division CPR2 bacterium GWD2_39_7]